jgi:hypothetical protein
LPECQQEDIEAAFASEEPIAEGDVGDGEPIAEGDRGMKVMELLQMMKLEMKKAEMKKNQ